MSASYLLSARARALDSSPDTAPQGSAGLPTEDDCLELLECARYGEDDELRELLTAGVPVDYKDDSGNTALHRASANGHVSIVEVLAASGAKYLPNASGNMPLHWAVQQGHLLAAKALLKLFAEVDVLAQNSFGRSVSTEAFASGNADMVELILQHPSAQKLEPEEALDEAAGMLSADVTHVFEFAQGQPSIEVRELAEIGSDDPTQVLGATADEDRTGLQLWAASLVLSHWLLELRDQLAGRAVCELGAGCGLCGIVAAKLCGAAQTVITDLAPRTIENLQHNLTLNGLHEPRTRAAVLDWRHASTWPEAHDVLIGADLVYADEAVAPLLRVVQALVTPQGCFLYVAPETNRQGEAEFLKGLCAAGFECQVSAVPTSYLANILQGRDAEEFDLLFGELKQRTYSLYCFSRGGSSVVGPKGTPKM